MAVKKYALRSLSDEDLGSMLYWSDAFLASNVSAHGTTGHSRTRGRLSDEMFAQYVTSVYAVYSYETAIAWRTQGQWYVNGDRYSNTTTYHQGMVKAALKAANLEFTLL